MPNNKTSTILPYLALLLLSMALPHQAQSQLTPPPDPLSADKNNQFSAHWIYGISFGAYFANSFTANYYNGSKEHSIHTTLNQSYNRDRLIKTIDEIIESFEVGDLPVDMHYTPSMQIGFFGGYQLRRSFAFLVEFNYTKLKVSDKFTLFTDQYTSTSEPYRLLGDIYGSEERIDLRLGVQYTMFTTMGVHPFIESGVSITDTKVIENRINIGGLEFNIRNISTEYYNIRDYGIGPGIYSSLGINMQAGPDISLRAGGSVNISRVNLGDYNNFKPQYTLFLRLNLNKILSK